MVLLFSGMVKEGGYHESHRLVNEEIISVPPSSLHALITQDDDMEGRIHNQRKEC